MTATKCPTCGEGVLAPTRRPVDFQGVRLGTFAVSVCSHCGAEVVDAQSSDAIDAAFERAWAEGKLEPPAGWKASAKARASAPPPKPKGRGKQSPHE